MPRLIVANRAGEARAVTGEAGLTVMEVIRANAFDELLGLCGGCCSCATCHLYVDPAWTDRLPPIGLDEEDLLDSSQHRDSRSRLACQIPFGEDLDGLRVTIAPGD